MDLIDQAEPTRVHVYPKQATYNAEAPTRSPVPPPERSATSQPPPDVLRPTTTRCLPPRTTRSLRTAAAVNGGAQQHFGRRSAFIKKLRVQQRTARTAASLAPRPGCRTTPASCGDETSPPCVQPRHLSRSRRLRAPTAAADHAVSALCQVAHGPWFQQQDKPFWELTGSWQPEPRYDTNVRPASPPSSVTPRQSPTAIAIHR